MSLATMHHILVASRSSVSMSKTNFINGDPVYSFENKFSKFCGSKYAVACNSGSAGIFLTLKALGIQNNDEVIVPTITFIATVNAVTQNNAEPIFMDCDDKFNLDTIKTLKFFYIFT